MKRLPPGLPIPCYQDKHDIFIGMTTTGHSPIKTPYIGHHILDHTILDPPTYPSNSSKRRPDSLDRWHHLALDIHFPTLGLGLYDLLANSKPQRSSAFPNFERNINFHVAYFRSSSSAKPMDITDTAELSSNLSLTTTTSSRSTTVCSSVSSSPTLSSISTPGGNFVDNETVGESMMSHEDILKVCSALFQTIELTRANQQYRCMSSRRVGVIGGHLPPKTWSIA
ncbi:hypothetical protein K457DRAFT_31904 [Linnemannia elongata AG-77]|uniref:Uncharacterized protein n=1 Tax=Linnemannia elongata AG-77 TaxID=1314771 RepID=A0A197JX08_9FUNG|nr:hypothetical protein K457DRAFT_31904 [Linnemannia elongata AG-77]